MNTQPEALRLADIYEAKSFFSQDKDVAAELRRLHKVEMQKNAMAEGLAEGAKALRKANDDIDRLHALNAELLKTLERMLESDKGIAAATDAELQEAVNDQTADPVVREQASAVLQARAVIAKAESKS